MDAEGELVDKPVVPGWLLVKLLLRGVDKLLAADRGHERAGFIGGTCDGAAGADDGNLASHEFKYKRHTGKISLSATSIKAVASNLLTQMSILED